MSCLAYVLMVYIGYYGDERSFPQIGYVSPNTQLQQFSREMVSEVTEAEVADRCSAGCQPH